jgi:hypothetical protein
VAVREALYALTVLAVLCINPAFLLVDVGTSVDDGERPDTDGAPFERGLVFLAAYVLAPEKVALAAAFDAGGYDMFDLGLFLAVVGVLLDLWWRACSRPRGSCPRSPSATAPPRSAGSASSGWSLTI